MIYIPNPSLDPAYNQAFEECAFELPEHDTILILWRNRPAVVCGRYQNLLQEVHAPTALKQDVCLIRRTTGGGCVYHDPGNVNYTLICDEEAGYDRILARTLEALNRIGVPAARFQSSGIGIGGCKISGSAQRVSKGRLLHHGTLLYDADLTALRRLANGHSDCYTSKAIRSAPAPVTNIRKHSAHPEWDAAQFMEALKDAFGPDEILQPDFADRAQQLANEKYRTWAWTYSLSPKYAFSRRCDFFGSALSVSYRAEKAVIRELRIECDGLDAALLTGALEGEPLNPPELLNTLSRLLDAPGQAERLLHCLF